MHNKVSFLAILEHTVWWPHSYLQCCVTSPLAPEFSHSVQIKQLLSLFLTTSILLSVCTELTENQINRESTCLGWLIQDFVGCLPFNGHLCDICFLITKNDAFVNTGYSYLLKSLLWV